MTIRTQVALQSQIDSLFADNSAAGISAADARSVFTDLVDTAADRWTDTSVSPLYNGPAAVEALITAFADSTSNERTPAEVRNTLAGIADGIVFNTTGGALTMSVELASTQTFQAELTSTVEIGIDL